MKRVPRSLFNLIGLVIALLVIFGAFTLMLPGSFATVSNVQTILRQSAIVALLALGTTYVIVGAGIDLSIGSIAAFASVVVAWMLNKHYSPIVSLLGGVAAGTLAGVLNGALITFLKVGPFIVTLGTMLIIRGVGTGIAHEETINPPDSWLNNLLKALSPNDSWQLVAPGVWITVVLAILAGLALKYTRFGRHVVAVGSNVHAARLCGVPVDRVTLLMYVISGASAGLGGLMLFSKLTVGDPTVANGMELDVIAAVVIGGASLTGGEGSILGSMLGALIMATLRAGAAQKGLDTWVQQIVVGIIIVLAVGLDRFRKLRST